MSVIVKLKCTANENDEIHLQAIDQDKNGPSMSAIVLLLVNREIAKQFELNEEYFITFEKI